MLVNKTSRSTKMHVCILCATHFQRSKSVSWKRSSCACRVWLCLVARAARRKPNVMPLWHCAFRPWVSICALTSVLPLASEHHYVEEINPPIQELVHPVTGCCSPAWKSGKCFLEAFGCPCPGQPPQRGKGVHTPLPGDSSPLAARRKLQTLCDRHSRAPAPVLSQHSCALHHLPSYSPAARIRRPSVTIKEMCGCSKQTSYFFPRGNSSSSEQLFKMCKAFGKWFE